MVGGGDNATAVKEGPCPCSGNKFTTVFFELARPFGDEPFVIDAVSKGAMLDAERAVDAFDFPLRVEW